MFSHYGRSHFSRLNGVLKTRGKPQSANRRVLTAACACACACACTCMLLLACNNQTANLEGVPSTMRNRPYPVLKCSSQPNRYIPTNVKRTEPSRDPIAAQG